MNIIIAGSRVYDNYRTLKRVCDEVIEKTDIGEDPITIICGCAHGADALGDRYGYDNRYEIKYFKADWEKYGKGAGPMRNRQMAEVGDMLIAFPIGKSKGTLNMVKEAMKRKLKVYVYEKDNLMESK